MAVKQCREIQEWIEEEVSRPIEEWEQRQEERCKKEKCKWWMLCLNKLFCWLVWVTVKVVRWVVVTVGKWVTRTVCTLISLVVALVVAVAVGLWNIVVGIVTWDWARVWDGFVGIVLGAVEAVFGIVRIVLLGDTIDFIREEVNKHRLRDHVRGLLEQRFARDPEALAAAKEAIGVDHGAFGLRLDATAIRTFVSSDRRANDDDVPALVTWHEDDELDIDIRQLAGYDHASFWRRGRPEVVGADEDEVDSYIADRGGRSFRIYPMSERLLRSKADVAEERARELGLMLRFDLAEREVVDPADVVLVGSSASQDRFNVAVLDRTDETTPPDGAAQARSELCEPVGAGVFGYQGSFIGYSSHLDDATCVDGDPFPGSRTSGVSFLDRVPDTIFRYVFVHELGHYFGLCHVSGANRIMFTSNKDADLTWWSWGLLPEYLYLEGGPRFVFDEAKRAWDYIVAGFPTECLTTRAH